MFAPTETNKVYYCAYIAYWQDCCDFYQWTYVDTGYNSRLKKKKSMNVQ